MKREDYIFTIGFDGNRAVVDRKARNKYGKLDTQALAEQGLFRAAYRSAVFDNDEEASQSVLAKYNTVSPLVYENPADLLKVFGIQPPSDDITGILLV